MTKNHISQNIADVLEKAFDLSSEGDENICNFEEAPSRKFIHTFNVGVQDNLSGVMIQGILTNSIRQK